MKILQIVFYPYKDIRCVSVIFYSLYIIFTLNFIKFSKLIKLYKNYLYEEYNYLFVKLLLFHIIPHKNILISSMCRYKKYIIYMIILLLNEQYNIYN